MLLALAVPFAGIALASHAGNDSHDLQVIPETDENPTGTTHTLTAWVPGCFDATGTGTDTCNVDFEVESGPSIFVVKSEVNSNSSVDDADTELTPDMSCTIDENRADDPETAGNESTQEICSVQFTSGTAGTNVIRAWVDEGGNTSADADQDEGRNAGASDCVASPGGGVPADPAVCSDPGTPGTGSTEPDDTDVVSKTWVGPTVGTFVLDYDDASGPSGNDPAASDSDVNQPNVGEVYTCNAWNTAGAGSPATGQRIDAEAAAQGGGDNGANDPDNRGFNNALNSTADFDNACVTDNNGTCTFTFNPSDTETGGADLCFWIDQDNDAAFANSDANTDASQADGDECDEEAFNDGEGGTGNRGDDETDVVRKTWGAATPATLDLEPENDANQTGTVGTQHTVTATVHDSFGNPSANTPVDFVIQSGSRNDLAGADRVICDNKLTNASGVVDCTYTDEGTTSDPIGFGSFETDVISACIDPGSTAGAIACAATPEQADAPEQNDTDDTVEKYWFLTVPAAGFLDFDIDANDDYPAGPCNGVYDTAAEEAVGAVNAICALVRDANGNAVPGKNVTFTITGTGVFFDDRDQDEIKDAGEPELGKTVTVGADQTGDAFATIWSNTTGTSTVTATSDTQSKSATKTWVPGEPRRVDCPEAATNVPGTPHILVCDVTDRNGNPVNGVIIEGIESGPGSFVNCPDPGTEQHYGVQQSVCEVTTDPQGEVEFQIISNTEGTQTLEIATDLDAQGPASDRGNAGSNPPDTDDACDARANEGFAGGNTQGLNSDAGAEAGQCFDTFVKTWAQGGDDTECSDGEDNDNDGDIDLADSDCDSAADDNEGPSGFVPGPCRDRGPDDGNVIVGTSGADVLQGTSGRDIICGAGGDDAISSRGGNDLVVGNAGDDTIGGGRGKDNLSGNSGDDTASGDNGNDAIKGNGGADTLKGNAGIDTLTGGDGNDTLQGGDNDDVLRAGGGNDTLRGGDGNDALAGGPGNDQCFGNRGSDNLTGCE